MKKELEEYFDRLWPICRSITGQGVRDTLKILQELIPLNIQEIPTGKKVFDWVIPKEWNIRDAYIITPDGRKICSFKENNLHLVSYSIPVDAEFSFGELRKHLHTIPEWPDAIPYVTAYYKETWGFCIPSNILSTLSSEGKYKVLIESTLEVGNLTYGDLVLKGGSSKEILFSTYICHPSMANNELSGPLVTAFLYKKIAALKNRKYSYRFVFVPETIGAISYLFHHGFQMKENVEAGYVVTCVGTTNKFTYKKSRRGNSMADRVAENILKHSAPDSSIIEFDVGGSDERQYCSSGFNMPVGSLMRSVYKEYKEYHTSLDNKNFISFSALEESVDMYFQFVQALELNEKYSNTNPFCEPMLGKRGLYNYVQHGDISSMKQSLDLLFLLAYADGDTDLVGIAEKRHRSVLDFVPLVEILLKEKLLSIKHQRSE